MPFASAAFPFWLLACLLDQTAAVCGGRTRLSNAYRIVARRDHATVRAAAGRAPCVCSCDLPD